MMGSYLCSEIVKALSLKEIFLIQSFFALLTKKSFSFKLYLAG